MCIIKIPRYVVLLLSCHQTAFFHLSTHFLAFSLNFWRSSKVQGCASNGHCNICLVVSGAWPHSHVVSPLKYFHLLRCSLLHATPVRNLLRHLHAAQGLVCPFAKLSSRLTAQLRGDKFWYKTKMVSKIINEQIWQLCSPECNCHCWLNLPQI